LEETLAQLGHDLRLVLEHLPSLVGRGELLTGLDLGYLSPE
jgi:hypothetical protein